MQNRPTATLVHAIRNQNNNEIFQLLNSKADINEIEPISGRNALHEAAALKLMQLLAILMKRGANNNIRDKEGALPIELYLAPTLRPFADSRNETRDYQHFMIDEANRKLRGAKINSQIVLIENVEEINQYILEHPNSRCIGFVVRKPNCLRQANDMHVVPIYFECNGNTQTFAQFDSALGEHFLIPSLSDDLIQRQHFFTKGKRQASSTGCFEDAIIILMKLLKRAGIVAFCEKYSEPLSPEYFEKLDYTEEILFHKMITMQKDFNQEQANQFHKLQYRSQFTNQMTVFGFLDQKFSPQEKVFCLKTLPSPIIPHVERFDTMRHYRVNEKEKVEKVFDEIVKFGSQRNVKMTFSEIKQKLNVDDPKYDIQGRNFATRSDLCHKFHSLRLRYYSSAIQHKLNITEEKNAMKLEEKSKQTINKKIIGFITRF